MINDRMRLYDVSIRQDGQNPYGEPLTSYIYFKTVEVSITLITKIINELDPRYLTSTHIGLTYDHTLKEGMRLVNADVKYLVKIATNDCRMAQLTLEEVI